MSAADQPNAYRKAGVDVKGADQWIGGLSAKISSTHGPAVLKDRGHFAGMYALGQAGGKDPVLVSSTDGVGTKLKIAELVNRHDTIGIDLVAMNVNDIVTTGARPLFFLDYLAVGKLNPAVMNSIVEGVIAGCRESDCALLGGETAEMPGVYASGSYDLAGFCVGVVERDRIIDGKRVAAGDAVIGIGSTGIHSNGYSLVRHVLSESQIRDNAEALLEPTRIYVKPVLNLLKHFDVRSISHITGGGLSKRLKTLVQEVPNLKIDWDVKSWEQPPVFDLIRRAGNLSDVDLFATFNMGIGMALAVSQTDAEAVIQSLGDEGFPAWQIGRIQ